MAWNIKGRLKNSNHVDRFDVQDFQIFENGQEGRFGNLFDNVDKMVFERKDKWIIVDMKELSKFLLDNNTLKIHLDDLITNTDWTVFIPKNKL
jgi:hypothetical protein